MHIRATGRSRTFRPRPLRLGRAEHTSCHASRTQTAQGGQCSTATGALTHAYASYTHTHTHMPPPHNNSLLRLATTTCLDSAKSYKSNSESTHIGRHARRASRMPWPSGSEGGLYRHVTQRPLPVRLLATLRGRCSEHGQALGKKGSAAQARPSPTQPYTPTPRLDCTACTPRQPKPQRPSSPAHLGFFTTASGQGIVVMIPAGTHLTPSQERGHEPSKGQLLPQICSHASHWEAFELISLLPEGAAFPRLLKAAQQVGARA